MMDGYLAVILLSMLVGAQADTCDTCFPSCLVAVPGKSCKEIYQLNPSTRGKSGYYAIQPDTDKVPQNVYCDMELECGGEKGWMRIASIDANANSCPSGWNRTTSPVAACTATSNDAGCYSASFSTDDVPYSKVCGMVIGYQKGSTDGFAVYRYPSQSIDGPYVDGVSITYGTPREHIWTYAIGNNDNSDTGFPSSCPCSQFPGDSPPAFVGSNYYCESGRLLNNATANGVYYKDDPVWDGENCSTENTCCSDPSLPWFHYRLPLTTLESIDARICRDELFGNEDVLVKEIKLFVQ